MPVIMAPADYARWLGDAPDPRDLMRPFPADLMRMWPISTRVDEPENDDPSIVEPIELPTDARLEEKRKIARRSLSGQSESRSVLLMRARCAARSGP